MWTNNPHPINDIHAKLLANAGERLREAERFHMGCGQVHKTLEALIRRLNDADIGYAIIGGMALNAHGYRRETTDVDVLLTQDGLQKFITKYIPNSYTDASTPKRTRYIDLKTQIVVDIVISGNIAGRVEPCPVLFPDPQAHSVLMEGICVITLPKLIDIKLSSGMTTRSRLRDLADIQELARELKLGLEYADYLHPFVRDQFTTLVQAILNNPRREE